MSKKKPTKKYILKVSMQGPKVELNVGDEIELNEDQLPAYIEAEYIDAPDGYVKKVEKSTKDEESKDSGVKGEKRTLSKMNLEELKAEVESLDGINANGIKKAMLLKPKKKIVEFIKTYKVPE